MQFVHTWRANSADANGLRLCVCLPSCVQVAMRALGFDVKKAEVLKLMKDYDR